MWEWTDMREERAAVVEGGGGRALWATVVVCCCMVGCRNTCSDGEEWATRWVWYAVDGDVDDGGAVRVVSFVDDCTGRVI
jgi:hypothetical protein